MDIKKEIESELELLKAMGVKQAEIAEKLGYRPTGISEVKSKGGSDKLYKSILLFKEWYMLKNSILSVSEAGKDNVDYKKKYMELLEEVSALKTKLINSVQAKSETLEAVLRIEPSLLALQAVTEIQSQSFSVELAQATDKILTALKR